MANLVLKVQVKTDWYFVRDIWVQGTFEKRFVEACKKFNILIKRNKNRIPYNCGDSEKTYAPDLLLMELRAL